jgi:hypothetical protein
MTKDDIKTWLKRTGKDRAWLGAQLSVGKKTVDNWLSSPKRIPEAKLALIQRLHADDVAAAARQTQLSEPTNQIFSVEVDHARFRRYNAAAASQRKTMEQWTIQTLDHAVETARTTTAPESRLNEPPTQYATESKPKP